MDELINSILEEGRNSDDLGAIFKGISERLVAQGIPLRPYQPRACRPSSRRRRC